MCLWVSFRTLRSSLELALAVPSFRSTHEEGCWRAQRVVSSAFFTAADLLGTGPADHERRRQQQVVCRRCSPVMRTSPGRFEACCLSTRWMVAAGDEVALCQLAEGCDLADDPAG